MASTVAAPARQVHFSLPPLPYAEDALAPVISAETLKLHHGKHHKKYVDTANQLLEKEPLRASSVEEVVRQAKGKLFNNAAQAWNHDFYWKSLSPKRQRPSGALLHRLEKDFGSYDKFADAFSQAAIGQFASGWAWLVEKGGKLEVTTTGNADTPMAHGIRCLLTVDVWEHAYYVDYRNERERYVSAILNCLNWDFVEKNLG
ncbi:MAG TPA: superoxide dismutase [Burkholderiales bacterium]|jgi:Fe-Mn family superoxide dismutase|nr:superoxide dismutase [Burkholderiales bacterium]